MSKYRFSTLSAGGFYWRHVFKFTNVLLGAVGFLTLLLEGYILLVALIIVQGRWLNGLYAGLWIQGSGCESWPGSLCCVLGQETTLTVPLSIHAGGNQAIG